MGRQREEQTPVYGPEGIHAQVAALAATLVSTLLSIGVLLGIEAQQQGRLPREAGSRLTALTRLGVVLTAAATFYFFCPGGKSRNTRAAGPTGGCSLPTCCPWGRCSSSWGSHTAARARRQKTSKKRWNDSGNRSKNWKYFVIF